MRARPGNTSAISAPYGLDLLTRLLPSPSGVDHDRARIGPRCAARRDSVHSASPPHRRGPPRRADQPQPQGHQRRRNVCGANPGGREEPAGHRPRRRARQLGRRREGRRRRARAPLPPRRGPRRRLPTRSRAERRRPPPPRRPAPRGRRVPPAARRAPLRQRLRHVRDTGPIPADRRRARVPAAPALRRVRADRRPHQGGARAAHRHGALQQRPARREPAGLSRRRRRRTRPHHRLRVLRQQRPVLRAGQHLERGDAARCRCSTSSSRPTTGGRARGRSRERACSP